MKYIERNKADLDHSSGKKPAVAAGDNPLPKITVDGKAIEFMPGDTIMQAMERIGKAENIPRFCYHPGLSVAGSCRMCTVEVENAPKLMTSCSTPASDNMVVHTNSEKVLKSRNGVMEFLLANHPLDCPVCDKAGECDLQDYDFAHGSDRTRFCESKRVLEEATTKALSDKITLNANRCVHCERCVRFTDEVTKTHDLVMLNRGWHKEITATEETGMHNDYQGCVADICPVGALTFNDFRFEKRVWFLKKKPSICDGCSKGCNIDVHHSHNVVKRYMPIFNDEVNKHWMCDEGRVSYKTYANTGRITSPMIWEESQKKLVSSNWPQVATFVNAAYKNASKKLIVLGTDVTNQEATLAKNYLNQATIKYHSGFGENKAVDHLLKQTDKTPNTRGLKDLGLADLQAADAQGQDLVVLTRYGRATLPQVEGCKVIAVGIFQYEELQALSASNQVLAVLPGLASIEKEGSFTNCDGITQNFRAALEHKGQALPFERILAALVGSL